MYITCSLKFMEAKKEDVKLMLDIYNYYIMNSTATFDWEGISLAEFNKRIYINHMKYKTFLVYEMDEMIGFSFLTQYRNKVAYDDTVELGLYLKPPYRYKGYGEKIVKFMEKIAVKNKFNSIIASISGENLASTGLFKKLDYAQCAHYKEIAVKFHRKIDIIDFQKMLH